MVAALARSNALDCDASVCSRCINVQASDRLNRLAVKREQLAGAPFELPQQRQAAIAAQIAAAEVGFNRTPAEAAEINPILHTLWQRQSSVVPGVQYL
jgi:hypothetical protein